MVLLRRVIGDTLRARRQAQHRTLREVSTAANVSLGYLSEIERGQKEASSELLAAICDALGTHLSDVLREVSQSVAVEEQTEAVLVPAREARPTPVPEMRRVADARPVPDRRLSERPPSERRPAPETTPERVSDGEVCVTVRRDSPLRTTLLARRRRRERELVGAV